VELPRGVVFVRKVSRKRAVAGVEQGIFLGSDLLNVAEKKVRKKERKILSF